MKMPRSGALSVPNLITYFRLLLIPVFVYVYLEAYYCLALAVLILSGLSDMADGWIARRYHMVTDLGKIIDPVADKLTQAAMIFCVAWHVPAMWTLLGILVAKELIMLLLGWYTLKTTGVVNSAKWYGKACTGVLYVSMALMVLFPDMPTAAIRTIMYICLAALVMSLTLYSIWYIRFLRSQKGQESRMTVMEHELFSSRLSLIMWEIVGVIILISLVMFFIYRNDITIDAILSFTPNNLYVAAAVFIALFALKSITVVFYVKLLYMAVGIVFPLPVALLVNIVGSAVELTIPYLEGHFGGKKALNALLERRPRLKGISDLQTKNNFAFSALLRTVGILPIDPMSIYLGATGMDYPSFLGGSLVGMLPSIVITTVMGVSVDDPGSPTFIVSAALFVVAQVVAVLGFTAWKKHTKKQEDLSAQKAGK